MTTIPIFRVGTRRLRPELLRDMGVSLRLEGKILQSDQALAMQDRSRTLVYAQPGARFAGLLFYIDQTRGMATKVEKIVDEGSARGWAEDFLKRFEFHPNPPRDKRFLVAFETYSYEANAVTYDGKERAKKPVGIEVASRISLNSVAVIGPRAKVRMLFKDQEIPTWVHCSVWGSLGLVAEKDLLSEHDAVRLVRDRLHDRRGAKVATDIVNVRLAYYLGEYRGGPDLLLPYYFIEVEFKESKGNERSDSQGPGQVIQVPACP